MPRKYTNEQFVEAYNASKSVRQLLQKLDLKAAGGNYQSAKRLMAELGLEPYGREAQAWAKGMSFGPKRSLEDYLVDGSTIASNKLRRRLISEGYKEARCESCNLDEWLGEPIPLELDHKNGKHSDNRIENLQILCPNCHAKTPNYRGKNIGKAA